MNTKFEIGEKKTIFFIETNFAGNACKVMNVAKENGYKTHFLTQDPSVFYGRMNPLPSDLADECTVIDCYDISKLLQFFQNYKEEVSAVLTFDDFHLPHTAIINEFLGLKAASLMSVQTCRNKAEVRKYTNQVGSKVKYALIALGDSLPSDIGFPCVVKPCDESGSVGVSICDNLHEFDQAVQEAFSLPENTCGYERSGYVMVEEYIDGDEFSAELFWDHQTNDWKLIGVTKKFVTEGKYPVEKMHTFPAFLNDGLKYRITENVREWLNCIGLKHTVAHVEFKFGADGNIYLIEINPRMAGGNIANLIEVALGESLFEIFFEVSLNSLNRSIKTHPDRYASVGFLIPKKSGIIADIRHNNDLENIQNVNLRSSFPIKYTEAKSASFRLGNVIGSGDTEDESRKCVENFIDNISVEYLNE